MIKQTFLILICTFLSLGLYGQSDNISRDSVIEKNREDIAKRMDDAPSDTAWKAGARFTLLFNQAAYKDWQAGGVNSVSTNGTFKGFMNYDDGGDWSWFNRLQVAYGMSHQDNFFNKTDDRILLESRLDRRISKHWSASALGNFRTQFAPGYSVAGETADSLKISDFMAPGYLLVGIGFTYKPNDKFSAYISPATSKMTWVTDARLSSMGAFGVDSGQTFRYEIGGYANLIYNTPIVKNVRMEAELGLFSNYLDGNYEFIDVNGELDLFFEINNYLTANVSFAVMYDHDVIFDTSEGGTMRRTQFKEVLGIGFIYNMGYKVEE